MDSIAPAALLATRDRWPLLIQHALPSVRRQTRQPAVVVVVNDGRPFSRAERARIGAVLGPIPATVLQNTRPRGAAGAWNTGIAWLREQDHRGFVAMLDDDDAWDDDHLAANGAAAGEGAEVTVSGLRRVVDGVEVPRPLPAVLASADFIVGNPGWQGSNTCVSMRLLARVGGFRDGLASLNDRDLAVRLLRCPGVHVGYTGRWTATWHVRTGQPALSAPRSAAKISGLRWFWRIYGPEMTPWQEERFFERASRCFGVAAGEITRAGADVPPHTYSYGDLDA